MRPANPADYLHPQDKKTLENFKQIPGFSVALKAFMKLFNEKMIHGLNMSNKIRLGPDQLGTTYSLLPPICKALGIEEPEFYLEMNPSPNAYTYGDSIISVTITSGLLDLLEEDELIAVLAHECGHIACHHVLYKTMGKFLLSTGADLLNLGVLALPLQLALFHWERCAEFSCDRAAAIYMRGSKSFTEALMRLAGGGVAITNQINMDLYLQQAKEYEQLLFDSNWDKALQFFALMNSDHPFLSVRANQIVNWCETDQFKSILRYMDNDESACPGCGKEIDPNWKFCRYCGKSL